VKIYAAAVEALRKKEIQDETQFSLTTKIDGFLSFMLMYFFCRFFFIKFYPVYDQTQGSGAVFCVFLTLWITILTLRFSGSSDLPNACL
jgi:hypothetical protein